MEGESRPFWSLWRCLKCKGEFISKRQPKVCPFCLADSNQIVIIIDLVHKNPGQSEECPGFDSAH